MNVNELLHFLYKKILKIQTIRSKPRKIINIQNAKNLENTSDNVSTCIKG